ncbi:hypothetical protein ANCCEY_06961 [Ancylostoma ceylanicum]|uniref:PAS domain-containing protein n=1 Tax=Ancylostoma ceylanicum TaxID=53326 RepID=A0A0D6M228_9BILA|nr:hypothetical protein ANCCEY_06961 [Ancylostoma ceylanicum]
MTPPLTTKDRPHGVTNHACELLCEFESKRARVTALALRAAYGPSTPFHSLTFTTKHAASCALTHIDYTSIPYLGHLPTDLIGRSILAFVYAPDVHVIRQAHVDCEFLKFHWKHQRRWIRILELFVAVHNSRGRVVRSVTSLRFVAYNGALLRADTEWSAYVNPWTKKIDMVVARHRILDAPIGDANVLDSPANGQSLHVLPPAMAKTFEDELRALMNKVSLPSSTFSTSSDLYAALQPGASPAGYLVPRRGFYDRPRPAGSAGGTRASRRLVTISCFGCSVAPASGDDVARCLAVAATARLTRPDTD